MIRSILELWFGNLFLFFFNYCSLLDDEFANGLLDGMAAARKQVIIQANYRKAIAK
jgi:hypothetical protein